MLFNRHTMQNTSVFIFAHQDDEFGIYPEIERLINNQTKVIIFYLTSGSLDGKPRQDRNAESSNVLKDIGINKEDIHFLGTEHNIPAAKMHEYLDILYPELIKLINNVDKINSLYFLSWEGGHQDHDATHLIGLALAKKLKILDQSYQFTLYSGHNLPWILFKLFSPLASNGNVTIYKVSWALRLKFIKYVLSYRSQVVPIIGLFPFFLFHQIFKGTQILQNVSINRVLERPHSGRLLYERRSDISFNEFSRNVQHFVKTNITQK